MKNLKRIEEVAREEARIAEERERKTREIIEEIIKILSTKPDK